MTERWLPVVGYEGLYEVSDLGRVRSLDRWIAYRDGRQRFYRGRVFRPYNDKAGRPQVNLSNASAIRHELVAHLVLEAFDRPALPGEECRHGPARKPDGSQVNRLDNLSWTRDHAANIHDKIRDGTQLQGEGIWNAKLSDATIAEIRALWDSEKHMPRHRYSGRRYTTRALGKMYDVCPQHISRIINRRGWGHVA